MLIIFFTFIGAVIGAIVGFFLKIGVFVREFCTCRGGYDEAFTLVIPCAIIGGAIGLVVGIFMTLSEKKDKEEKKRIAEENRKQEVLNSAFAKWKKQLFSCFEAIEGKVKLNELFDPGDIYDPIWKLGNNQPEPRYKNCYEKRLNDHINLLRQIIDGNLFAGLYDVPMCLSIAVSKPESS